MTLQSIKHFRNLIFWRIKNKWDCVIVITGTEGAGKSTFAIKLARELDPEFTMKGLLYDFADYLDFMESPELVGIFDEAVVAAYCRNWNAKNAKQLVEEITRNRYKLKVQIFIIPSMRSLEKYIREHRVWCWIHVPDRGVAEFHFAKRNKWGQVSKKYQEIRWEEAGLLRGFKPMSPAVERAYIKVKEVHDAERRKAFASSY